MTVPAELNDGTLIRRIRAEDDAALAAAYRRNRAHLAEWDPERTDDFYTVATQRREIDNLLAEDERGTAAPIVIARDERILGRVNISGIVRGAFESGNLGYWIDKDEVGRGLASAAVAAAVGVARNELGLHRLQAATLLHNARSQNLLARAGFERIGMATDYLRIAGRWQDHHLFQLILRR